MARVLVVIVFWEKNAFILRPSFEAKTTRLRMAKKSTRMAKTVANSTPKSLSPTPEFDRSSRSKERVYRWLHTNEVACGWWHTLLLTKPT
ncbi:unnamed protein product [Rhodiola kirilowii]